MKKVTLLAFVFFITVPMDVSLASSCPSYSGMSRFEDPLKVGAWNLQIFGPTKAGKENVMNEIVKVMRTFDIIAIQEVRDSKGKAPVTLLEKLNQYAYDEEQQVGQTATNTYELTISDRLGRTSSKEQYAFYTRKFGDRVTVSDTYQFPDTTDIFERPPYTVVFSSSITAVEEFAITVIHIKPSKATEEIPKLHQANIAMKQAMALQDVIILGDFNAGCTYVSQTELSAMGDIVGSDYKWLIGEHIDTTTKDTVCPYDRILINSPQISDDFYDSTAQPFYFEDKFGITDDNLVEQVSDHYPVQVLLKTKEAPSMTDTTISIGVGVSFSATSSDIACLGLTFSKTSKCVSSPDYYQSDGNVLIALYKNKPQAEIFKILQRGFFEFGCSILTEVESILSHKLEHKALTDASLYGESLEHPDQLTLGVVCYYSQAQWLCTLDLKATSRLV